MANKKFWITRSYFDALVQPLVLVVADDRGRQHHHLHAHVLSGDGGLREDPDLPRQLRRLPEQ